MPRLEWTAILRVVPSAVVALALLSNGGCTESLPPYVRPTVALTADLIPEAPGMVKYYEDHMIAPNVAPVLSLTDLPLSLSVGVVSSYEEVLQGRAEISGRIDIWESDNPSKRTVIPLTIDNAAESPMLDQDTRIVTIPPGQTFRLLANWNYQYDDGTWAFQYAPTTTYTPLGGGRYYRYHQPLNVKCRATVQIFKDVGVVTSEAVESPITFRGLVFWGP